MQKSLWAREEADLLGLLGCYSLGWQKGQGEPWLAVRRDGLWVQVNAQPLGFADELDVRHGRDLRVVRALGRMALPPF